MFAFSALLFETSSSPISLTLFYVCSEANIQWARAAVRGRQRVSSQLCIYGHITSLSIKRQRTVLSHAFIHKTSKKNTTECSCELHRIMTCILQADLLHIHRLGRIHSNQIQRHLATISTNSTKPKPRLCSSRCFTRGRANKVHYNTMSF